MKKIIALSGLSGAGKTYLREHDEELKVLPYLDIADIYMEYRGCDMGPKDAFAILLQKLTLMMGERDTVVVEAWFRRGSFQRAWLEMAAGRDRWEVVYIELDTPIEVCKANLRAQDREMVEKIQNPEEMESWKAFLEARLRLLELV